MTEDEILAYAPRILRALEGQQLHSAFYEALAGLTEPRTALAEPAASSSIPPPAPPPGLQPVKLALKPSAPPNPDASWLGCPLCSYTQQLSEGRSAFCEHLLQHRSQLLQMLTPEEHKEACLRVLYNRLEIQLLLESIERTASSKSTVAGFEVGEVVWAQETGFQWWPAQVSAIEQQRGGCISYRVDFFPDVSSGYGVVPETSIAAWNVGFEKYADHTCMELGGSKFKKALTAAEAVLSEPQAALDQKRKRVSEALTQMRKRAHLPGTQPEG